MKELIERGAELIKRGLIGKERRRNDQRIERQIVTNEQLIS